MSRLEEIRSRVMAATPDEWTNKAYYIASREPAPIVSGPCVGAGGLIRLADCETSWRSLDECHANAVFIAHARQDVPWLIDEVARLRAALERIAEMPIESHTCKDDQMQALAEAALKGDWE